LIHPNQVKELRANRLLSLMNCRLIACHQLGQLSSFNHIFFASLHNQLIDSWQSLLIVALLEMNHHRWIKRGFA